MTEQKMKVTAARSDDADDATDRHIAAPPAVTLAQQKAALKDGKILGFRCKACQYQQFSPMVRCPKCGSKDVEAREFSTTGTIVSYTIQSVAAEQFLNEVPFAFAVIQLDDGPKVSGWIPYIAKAAELPMGQKVVYTPSYKPGMMFEKR